MNIEIIEELDAAVQEKLAVLLDSYFPDHKDCECSRCLAFIYGLKEVITCNNTTVYQRGKEDLGEAVDEEITKVYRVLLDEFVYTGLATDQQWNETVAPAFKRLTNVANGLSPDSPTARVYKYPDKSMFPNY